MNAALKRLIAVCCALLGLAVMAVHAQDAQGKGVRIDAIKFDTANLPGEVRGNAAEQELNNPWYQIEVKFSTEAKAEEVSVKFYIDAEADTFKEAAEKGKFLVLTGEQVYVNVPKGREHYAVMFLDPMSLVRYGGKDGARSFKKSNVHVQVTAGDDKDEKDLTPGEGDWFEQGQQVSGVLLGLKDSPWWPSQAKRFNRIKNN
jgi:hypothetical protein